MSMGTRKPGEFCWINMLTPQPEQARAFFGALFGWTYVELPGMGHIVKVDGHAFGGLYNLEGPNTPKGTPPLISVMVKVESADVTCAKVSALGGTAKPPFDIMDQGRMAVCFDPNGAEFDIWESRKGLATDADSQHHGAPSWFETMTTDVERAAAFYSGLFGWTRETKPMPGGAYTTFKLGDAFVAGMMHITPEMGAMRPHWGTYFTVTDVDATAREAVRLGAVLHVPVMDVPGVGRMCGVTSPQGVMFYAITYAR